MFHSYKYVGAGLLLFWHSAAWAQDAPPPPAPPNPAFGYVVTGVVALSIAIGFGVIKTALENSPWSLADALSEEVTISALDANGEPKLNAGTPVTIIKLCASTSRFIALFGLVAILMMYLGFGLVILNKFASTGELPKPEQVDLLVKFLFAGTTMFAPYLINKFSSAFDWLTPKKS